MEIYGEKGARFLSLFCKFKLEKETNQHYQDKTVNSGTKKERGKSPSWLGSRFPGLIKKKKKVKQLNCYVTGTIASEG